MTSTEANPNNNDETSRLVDKGQVKCYWKVPIATYIPVFVNSKWNIYYIKNYNENIYANDRFSEKVKIGSNSSINHPNDENNNRQNLLL